MAGVRRQLGRGWRVIEMSDTSDRIREHRERQQQLKIAAEEVWAALAGQHVMLDSVGETATAPESVRSPVRLGWKWWR